MKEYKVVGCSDLHGVTSSSIQSSLNYAASDGWELKGVVSNSTQVGTISEVFLILERDKPTDTRQGFGRGR